MPDTSILFQRYLESGKLINVYDWFESFSVVLEAQRCREKKLLGSDVNSLAPDVPRTLSLRHSANSEEQREERSTRDGEGADGPLQVEEQLESWQLEAQARFIRALHELDYIGLIKHTGRKPSHVSRTIFDAPECD